MRVCVRVNVYAYACMRVGMYARLYARSGVCPGLRNVGCGVRNARPRPLRYMYAWFVIAHWLQSITYRFRRCLCRRTDRVAARCRISRLRAWVEECVGGLVGGGESVNT